MAFPEAEEKFLPATQRIEHALFVDDTMIVAMLKRCGHEMEDNTIDLKWTDFGVRVTWTTSVI